MDTLDRGLHRSVQGKVEKRIQPPLNAPRRRPCAGNDK